MKSSILCLFLGCTLLTAINALSQIVQPVTLKTRLTNRPSVDAANHQVKVEITNEAQAAYDVFWIDFQGKRSFLSSVAPTETHRFDTTPGHIFNVERKNGIVDGNIQARVEGLQRYRIVDPARPIQYVSVETNESLLDKKSLNVTDRQSIVHLVNVADDRVEVMKIDTRGRMKSAGWIEPEEMLSFEGRSGSLIEIQKANEEVIANFRISQAPEQFYKIGGPFTPMRPTILDLDPDLIALQSPDLPDTEHVTLFIENDTPDELTVFRNDKRGVAEKVGTVKPKGSLAVDTTPGFVFNLKADGKVVANLQASDQLFRVYLYMKFADDPTPGPAPTPKPVPVSQAQLLTLDRSLLNNASPIDSQRRKVSVKITNNNAQPVAVHFHSAQAKLILLGLIQPGQASQIDSSPGAIYTIKQGGRAIANFQATHVAAQQYRVGP